MKKLAFGYAGSFEMPKAKLVGLERENIAFAGEDIPTTVYTGNNSAFSFDKLMKAANEEIQYFGTAGSGAGGAQG